MVQVEDLRRVDRENRGLVERLDKTNVEISTLRFSVESARADAVVTSSKNVRLLNQLKGSHVECGALVEQLVEMHEQLKELGEQKSQFCKQVAELKGPLSASREMPQFVCVRPLRWMQSSSKARWRG